MSRDYAAYSPLQVEKFAEETASPKETVENQAKVTKGRAIGRDKGKGTKEKDTKDQIDPSVYRKVREILQDKYGRVDISDDPEKLAAINAFLQTYPYDPANKNANAKSGPSNGPWVDLPVRKLYIASIQTAIDIINDVSDMFSQQPFIGQADFRRGIFDAFARPDRRTYVGFWLIFLSFVLYFIDSAT